MKLEGHPNPRLYWIILRIMAIVSAVYVLILGGYASLPDIEEAAREAALSATRTPGMVWLAYVGLSQCDAMLERWKRQP